MATALRHRALARSAQLFCRLSSSSRHYSAPAERAVPPAKQKYVPTHGAYPKGFLVASTHVGVKASNTKHADLALIVSEDLCNAAGVFTTNAFRAAPVTVSQQVLRQTQGSGVRGVIINSGNANAVTGAGGRADAEAMVHITDQLFSQTDRQPKTLVMSTGVIGQRLPIERLTNKMIALQADLGDGHAKWLKVAQAICTTDTFPKLRSTTFTLPSHPDTTYSIAGIAKGAGMIHPNMATMLSVICTDARIDPAALSSMLRSATRSTFNSITVDGDTSTNDTINLFANGAAAPENKPALKTTDGADHEAMVKVLTSFMTELAQLIVRDGEGATKFVSVKVVGAADDQMAKAVANRVACSPLVKTALYGQDANWGRILMAVGNGVEADAIDPEAVSVSFVPTDKSQELRLITRGEPEALDEVRAKQVLAAEDLEIRVDLGDERGGHAQIWTCDFSHEYVTINGDYRT